jgi:hypothetical protein
MSTADVRVYTRDELLSVLGRPKIRDVGVPVRIAARFMPRPDDQDNARYELISPCCGKRTYVAHYFVERMVTGQWPDQGFECGRPWAGGRGNPRNGGCRARYDVQPALIEGGRPTAFDLTWTGHGEISKHPGGSGPTRWRS